MEGVKKPMKSLFISKERKEYIKARKKKKYLVLLTQILVFVGFIALWEILANQGIIDSFMMSQPSRIVKTFLNLSSNDLFMHVGVTVYETIVGFLLGTVLGIVIAILLWWSDFLAKVAEPYLVVLNSLPKVALRTSNYYLGWSRNTSNYSNGSSNIFSSNHIRKFKWLFKNRPRNNQDGPNISCK